MATHFRACLRTELFESISQVRRCRISIAGTNFDRGFPTVGQHHVCAEAQAEVLLLRQLHIEIDWHNANQWSEIEDRGSGVRLLGVNKVSADPEFGIAAETQADAWLNCRRLHGRIEVAAQTRFRKRSGHRREPSISADHQHEATAVYVSVVVDRQPADFGWQRDTDIAQIDDGLTVDLPVNGKDIQERQQLDIDFQVAVSDLAVGTDKSRIQVRR